MTFRLFSSKSWKRDVLYSHLLILSVSAFVLGLSTKPMRLDDVSAIALTLGATPIVFLCVAGFHDPNRNWRHELKSVGAAVVVGTLPAAAAFKTFSGEAFELFAPYAPYFLVTTILLYWRAYRLGVLLREQTRVAEDPEYRLSREVVERQRRNMWFHRSK